MTLRTRIQDDMKDAMRAKDAARLSTIRLLLAAIKQREVDERKEMADADVLSVVDKMIKQRKDSIAQFEAAARDDLAAIERYELGIIDAYLPARLGEAQILAVIDRAMAETGASSAADIGKLMGVLKPALAGQADMGVVSKLVKQKLA